MSASSLQTSQSQSVELDKSRPVHFIGIGGVGMSGLAKILLEAGYIISGSDVGENAYTQALKAAGATITKGHAAGNVPAGAMLIVSTSINPENPEIKAALEQGLPIHHRSALLKEMLQGKTFGHPVQVGLTGTHGKTSMTGMTGLALKAAGLDPTIIAGGKMPGLGTNAVWGEAHQIAVAELDESDGTIVQYQPTHAVIANLELDHADHYTDGLEGVLRTFRQFLGALTPGSKIFYNVGCPNTKALSEENPEHVEAILLAPGDVFTGDEAQTTYWLKNARQYGSGCYQGYVYRNRKMLGELSMGVPGMHNLMNGLCAVAVGDQLDADFDEMAEALQGFTGMGRRYEKVGEAKHALFIDDYAHHPTEVAATLKAAKEAVQDGPGRVIAVFQPHRYSRLKALWDEFTTCFDNADTVIITDVYSAHEPEITGVDAASFANAIQHPNARYVPLDENFATLRAELAAMLQPGDRVLSMGAGNITHLLRGWQP